MIWSKLFPVFLRHDKVVANQQGSVHVGEIGMDVKITLQRHVTGDVGNAGTVWNRSSRSKGEKRCSQTKNKFFHKNVV